MSWGNPDNGLEHLRASLLSPIAALYGYANTLDRLAYDYGFRQKNKLPVPVISVGNITCGGTGKTPFVIAIVRHLLELGSKVGVLTRGYGRRTAAELTVVSDGKGKLAPVTESGDEALLIAKSAKQAVVVSSANRFKAGMRAISEFGCDIFVLDDGFQHYSLARDLDIVLLDYNDDPSRDSLLPSGRLREPLSSLKRASLAVITKVPEQFDQKHMANLELLIRSQNSQVEIASCRFPSRQLLSDVDGMAKELPLSSLKDMKVVAFCGLARPKSFLTQVKDLGATVLAERIFPDHHWYSPQDLDSLQEELNRAAAEFLITTEKDFVKVQNFALKDRLLTIQLETEWLTPFPETLQRITAGVANKNDSLQLTKPNANGSLCCLVGP